MSNYKPGDAVWAYIYKFSGPEWVSASYKWTAEGRLVVTDGNKLLVAIRIVPRDPSKNGKDKPND